MNTETIRASEIKERVVKRIFEIRNPDAQRNYRKELAQYKRRLGKRKEGPVTLRNDLFGQRVEKTGFVVETYGKQVFIERPAEPAIPNAYVQMRYDRSFGTTTHASGFGLLAESLFNRDIRELRVLEYVEEMRGGRWRDLLSDPLTITTDGQVVNGQHRIAAATRVDWDKVENDPLFLVVWGVNPEEALFTDGSRRTARDEKTIATKLLVPK